MATVKKIGPWWVNPSDEAWSYVPTFTTGRGIVVVLAEDTLVAVLSGIEDVESEFPDRAGGPHAEEVDGAYEMLRWSVRERWGDECYAEMPERLPRTALALIGAQPVPFPPPSNLDELL